MKRPIVLIFLGCLIAKSCAQEGGGNGTVGTPEEIREDPENAKKYVDHGRRQFSSVQSSVDNHFNKKKAEGEQIHTDGETSQVEAAHVQGKLEKHQYDKMYETFKYADKEMDIAAKQVSDDGKTGGGGGGGGGGGEAATTKKKEGGAPAPAPAPAPAKEDEEEEEEAATTPPSPAPKKKKKKEEKEKVVKAITED